jgi:hypothetical protein
MFGPDQHHPDTIRHFGSAVLDGFSLDFEKLVTHIMAFGTWLNNLKKKLAKRP